MNEHISRPELFCNKRITMKSSKLDQNISILEMSCEYKKICGYEAYRCYACLKKLFTYMYWFKLFHCYCELNTGVAVDFVGYIMAAVSDGGGHGMKVT